MLTSQNPGSSADDEGAVRQEDVVQSPPTQRPAGKRLGYRSREFFLTHSNNTGTLELNEARSRYILIDPGLRNAGWNLDDYTQVLREVPVDGYDAKPWNGVTDYCLYHPSGEVIAVVEAKRTCRNPREGEEQLRHYVTEIAKRQVFAPFGFLTNGLLTYFWDVGAAHPRLVAGMFSPDDLERLRFIRENGKPPALEPINNAIVDRAYQHEAIRRAAEAFAAGKRRALLIMATGTGKTRTTMGLIDVFLRSSSAQKILFLADRDALVEQTLNDGFKAYLPHEPRVRIHTANIDRDKRLYVATLQTMSRCFEQFSPGFFDLIVFDEAHRSIFNRFTEVIEYFDARMVGLTATPAHFIGRDTFRVFECRDGTPTYLYTYPQAVAEKRLVDFRLYQAQTGFQRKGIKGAELSEEDRDLLAEQGLDPDALDYTGTELEVTVTNRDTLRRQWEEIMEVCVKDRAGKGCLMIGPTGQPMHVEEYRKRVELRILGITDQHPALIAIRAGLQPGEGDLIDLERVLHNELTNPEIQLSEKTVRQAYGVRLENRAGFLGFVRFVLDLDAIPDYAAVVAHSFEDHITANRYTSDQIRFLRSVQEVFIAKRRLAEADLYEAPLTNFGRNAVERFFTPEQIRGLVQLADRLTA